MAINLNNLKGTLTAIGDRVLVSDMFFGEQKDQRRFNYT